MGNSIFRKKSLDKISSPDQLDQYLKVSTPSAWFILLALALVAVSAGIWCIFGSIPQTICGTGIRIGENMVCFIPAEDSNMTKEGMEVRVTPKGSKETYEGILQNIEKAEKSIDAGKKIGVEWLPMPSEWVCTAKIQTKDSCPEGVACSVQIIVKEKSILELLLGR